MHQLAEISDAHCHLNLFENPEAIVRECSGRGMKIILATGGSAKDNLMTAELLKPEIVFGIVGIGPDFAVAEGEAVLGLRELVKSSKKIIGIGEIGLDFKITSHPGGIAIQKEVFERQIEIAKELEMPIVIHSRNSLDEVLKILDRHSVKRAMFHFFEGDGAGAKELEGRGYLISVPPVETSKRRDAIKSVDLRNLVAETDSPVVGKTPMDVVRSLEMIAKVRGIEVSEAAQVTTDSLREFFYI
ncbi:MAG: TatD family hydrolase [Candidatus Micrarchaeota archaeon]|nr:TatD family hydrolase [Candidatus Micrarchaeota archaeon]